MDMVEQLHSPDYEWFQTSCEPADVGYSATARSRLYCIGVHQSRASILKDPLELHEMVRGRIRSLARTLPQDYLVASTAEVQLEAQDMSRRRGIPYCPAATDLRYLLTMRELEAVDTYSKEYFHRYGVEASAQDGLFFYLGDNPSYSLRWSANGRLPTLRTTNGLMWSAKFKRWLTAKERLVSMGWPVTPEVAGAMAVPVIPAMDVKRASDLLGNSMHFLNTGVQQLIALSCFGPECPSMCF